MKTFASMIKLPFLLILLAIINVNYAEAGGHFRNETLHYVISYKWGLIHKDAGEATLTLKNRGQNYDLMLAAKTKPWADKVYSVRDTLIGSMRQSDLKPTIYKKITHEKGKYAYDEIKYSHNGNSTAAKAKRIRIKNDKPVESVKDLSGSGPVYDMLSIFYYLRKLDYSRLNKNKIYTATVFSGNKKETVKIHSLGIEKIKLRDKSEREAYHIRFSFTSDGGKKSSDNMDTWISTDPSHVPIYLVGKLPVGEVRAYLTSAS